MLSGALPEPSPKPNLRAPLLFMLKKIVRSLLMKWYLCFCVTFPFGNIYVNCYNVGSKDMYNKFVFPLNSFMFDGNMSLNIAGTFNSKNIECQFLFQFDWFISVYPMIKKIYSAFVA